jgi:hypothetical protein
VRAERMHPYRIDIDVGLVRRLLAAQFPQRVDQSLPPVRSAETANAQYRPGGMVVRCRGDLGCRERGQGTLADDTEATAKAERTPPIQGNAECAARGPDSQPDLGAHPNLHMADTAHDTPLALVVY